MQPSSGDNSGFPAGDQDRFTELQVLLARALSICVIASAIIAASGAVMLLFRDGSTRPDLQTYHPQPAELTSIHSIIEGGVHFRPLAVIQCGVLLLIITPVLRVLFSLLIFIARKDTMYAVITAIVLAVLLTGLLGGAA